MSAGVDALGKSAARRVLRLPTIEEIERELVAVVSKSILTRSQP